MPLTLAKNFPFEMQGRLSEARECCETALEAARLSASPHELYRVLFELGWTLYYAGDLDGAIAAHEESSRMDPRLAGGTIPNGGGGPGWGLGAAWVEAGEVERGRELLLALVGEDGARTMPVERCFDWETLTLASLALGDVGEADAFACRAEEDAGRLPLRLPTALAARARAAVLLAQDEPLEAAGWPARPRRTPVPSGHGSRRRSRAVSRDVRSSPPASAGRRPRCCARPSRSSTRAGRSACATRCAVSSGGSARGPSRAVPRPRATAASPRSRSASSRSRGS